MPWLVCWVVFKSSKAGMTQRMERKHTKMEGKRKMESLKKLISTRSHGRRDRVPSAKKQRRGCMTDATARLKQNAYDAVAWLMRPRGKEKLRMTRPRDPRGRVTEATDQKLQKMLIANSEALFGPNPSPEGIDQRLQSEETHPFRESSPISNFHDLDLVWERFSPLSLRIRIRI